MNVNKEKAGCFEAFLPRLLSRPAKLQVLAGSLRSLYACHEAAFGLPLLRIWQYQASAANSLCSLIVFNEGKK